MNFRYHGLAAFGLLCAALVAPRAAQAVNLEPNDSFEFYTACPTSFSQMYQAFP